MPNLDIIGKRSLDTRMAFRNGCQTKKLKILHLTEWWPNEIQPLDGIFVREHTLAAAAHHNVRVIFKKRWTDHPLPAISETDGPLRVYRLAASSKLIPVVSFLTHCRAFLKKFYELKRGGWYPDILHSHVYSATIPAAVLKKLTGLPLVVSEHWSGWPLKKLEGREKKKALWAMNSADIILPVSRYLEDAIREQGVKTPMTIVPNVVDTGIFFPSNEPPPTDPPLILYVGEFVEIKGLPLFLEALAQIADSRFKVVLVGDGPLRSRIEYLLDKYSLSSRTTLTGILPKAEVARLMREASFLVLPSYSENLPCVLLESLAVQLPVVASRVGGIPEIEGESGRILFEPGNLSSLVESLKKMLREFPSRRQNLASSLREFPYSREKIADKLDTIYFSLKRKSYSNAE